ncbi:MAG: polyprenyl synthetase family protein [Roseiflexaceae bacterium]|nr:polyprenyl synthetase family protein [Roseiflexus sp.]MDW8146571.1 polyprenyl synthetase family protein [Roseiflexaceae bacterium]MDW8231153.1 polyprenyl synthetase family protein [Roseiflexaceae bacterium]
MAHSPLHLGVPEQRLSEPAATTRTMPTGLGDILRRADLLNDMAEVERQMLARTASRSPLLAAAGAYTIAAGGKRLRAALVLLCARLGMYDPGRALHPAIAIELLHAASLIHDDLVDHAGQRRGHVTVHTRWDADVALLLGDYLFALAANELAAEPDPRIIGFYTSAAQTMVEGELNPVTQIEPLAVAVEQYYRKIGCKTAVLFEAACKAGIAVAGGDEAQIEALGRFGYDLGLAFQIVDDVLDYTGDEEVLGKPAGNDLREGTLTLPLMYAVAESRNPLLRAIANGQRPEPARVPQIVAAVIASGGADRAMEEARRLIERANQRLASFAATPARRALIEIGEFVINRRA